MNKKSKRGLRIIPGSGPEFLGPFLGKKTAFFPTRTDRLKTHKGKQTSDEE